MKLVCAFGLFAVFAWMLYGWGWATRRVLRSKITSWPATAALGMAAVVFLGGLLNLARLAHPWAFAVIAIAGIVLGILAIRSGERPRISFLSLIPAVLVLGFVVVTQLPPRAYNFHDDFQKYFAHPVRMLETGTLYGSPLNDIGLDTLGGQSFLNGFAVAFFPIRYINGVDAAFALFLCMMLAGTFRQGRKELLPTTLLCALSVIFINPQYVNVSALYTGAFLMMALIEEAESSTAVAGLFYAGLIALKSTFILFAVVHLAVALWVRGVKWTAKTTAVAGLFLLPWILLYVPHYVAIFGGKSVVADSGVRPNESFNIFSIQPLDYGSTPLHYTALMIAVALCGLLIARVRGRVEMTAASCFAVPIAYLIMVYVSGPRNAGYAQAVRYFTPFAIAIVPVAFGSVSLGLGERGRYRRVSVFATVATIIAFAPNLIARAAQSIHSGSELAFSWLAPDAEYIDYSQQVLYGDMRPRVAAAQAKVPAGEEMIVWINAPFYLDYTRNRIADVEPGAGLIAPWSKMPAAHYFIWEYGGYANMDEANYAEEAAEGPDLMRRVSAARLNMTRRLNDTMQRSEKLYDDGSIAVFRQ